MKDKFSILVSGCGSIGMRHLRNLKTLGVENLAVCDPDKASMDASGVRSFDDLSKALKEVKPDIVFICSPTKCHVEQAIKAAEFGAHVFIEKPLSYTLDGTQELENTANKNGVITMVGCNMRFHHGHATIKKLIDAGRIGKVISARIQTGSYLPSWRLKADYRLSYSSDQESGGAVLDCIHEICLALWYFGPAKILHSEVISADSIGIPVDGLAEILLKHDCGVLSSVHLNFIQRDRRRLCQIIGTEGSLYWDWEKGAVDLYGKDGSKEESFLEPPGWDANSMFLLEAEHFLSAVENGVESCFPVSAGIEALKIALEARLSRVGASARRATSDE